MARFFISYARPDLVWAKRIDLWLKGAGHETIFQDRDFLPGGHFIGEISEAIGSADRVIAVLSKTYLASDWAKREMMSAYHRDTLVPVRIHEAGYVALLSEITYIDLVGLDEPAAQDRLLQEVKRALERPVRPPGECASVVPSSPAPLNAELKNQWPDGQIPERSVRLPQGSRVLLPPPPYFVDRQNLLRELAKLLRVGSTAESDRVPTAVLTGPPGIGKTYLAQEFVYRYGRNFGGGVFWLNFINKDKAAVDSEIADCGLEFFNQPDFKVLPVDKQVKEVTRLWRGPDARLLVFDNCSELELLKELLPPHGGCSVLVTSRKTDWGGELTLDDLLLVPRLHRNDSLDLMRSYPGFPPAPEPVLTSIADELGDHPQALYSAASYISSFREDASRYLARLQQEGVDGLPWTLEEFLFRLSTGSETDRLALDFLSAAARISPGRPIPHQLLLDFANIQQENLHHQGVAALRQLDGIGLVQFHRESVLIDRLIARMIRQHESRHEKGARQDFESRMAGFLQRTIRDWNETVPTTQPIPERALIVDIITQLEDCETPQFAKLFHSFGLQLMGSGSPSTARHFIERAISIWEKVPGPESSVAAQGFQSLGELLQRQGDYPGARVCYERALKIRRQVLGRRHPQVAQTLNSLGLLFKQQGNSPGARWNYCRALVILRRLYGPLHQEVAQILNNLGVLAREKGELERARKFHEKALEIRETILGQTHPDRAESLHNLGAVLALEGDSERAQTYFDRALSLRREAFGSEHPDVADTLAWIGYLLERKGDREGAVRHYENARATYEERLGHDHPRTVRIQKLAEASQKAMDNAGNSPGDLQKSRL